MWLYGLENNNYGGYAFHNENTIKNMSFIVDEKGKLSAYAYLGYMNERGNPASFTINDESRVLTYWFRCFIPTL